MQCKTLVFRSKFVRISIYQNCKVLDLFTRRWASSETSGGLFRLRFEAYRAVDCQGPSRRQLLACAAPLMLPPVLRSLDYQRSPKSRQLLTKAAH